MILPPTEISELSLVDIPMAVPFDARRLARQIFWRGYTPEQIAEMLKVKPTTIRSWKARDDWDNDPPVMKVQVTVEARYCQLIMKEKKTGADFKEIDLLGRQFERLARIQKFLGGGNEADLNPNVANRNSGEKKPKLKNFISKENQEKLVIAFESGLFEYQKVWAKASRDFKNRFIIKSRQIGATYYFARESFIRAIETGNNQIFLSASKNQAEIFKQYIIDFVREICGIKLSGDVLEIHFEGQEQTVRFYFLGTNYRTAQGYHGDVYFDECFWVFGWELFHKVGKGMAAQKRYRRTYFSTPSSQSHDVFKLWSGSYYNKKRPDDQHIKIDMQCEGIKNGILYNDGIWRNVVTIEDAEKGGCDLFDIEELRLDDDFELLYLCKFIDDANSAFPFSLLEKCAVNAFEKWDDYNPFGLGKRYNGPVALGHDPAHSENGDNPSLVIMALPTPQYPKFRPLYRAQFKGKDYTYQAAEIKKLFKHFDIVEINIDTTGQGAQLLALVKPFFKKVTAINYNPVVKSQMVYTMQSLMRRGMIEIDIEWTDLIAAFMSIYPKVTEGGKPTFMARRSEKTGHGDLAWAALHTIVNVPPDGERKVRRGRARFN